MSPKSREREVPAPGQSPAVIDCDVHQTWSSPEELVEYLPPRYQRRGVGVPEILYKNPTGWYRSETVPEDEPPGASFDNLEEFYWDRLDVKYGILTGNSGLDLTALPNRDYASELARAYNRWQMDAWLDESDRLLGSLFVAPQDPRRAAETIREMGDHPQIAQVLMPSSWQLPYGQPFFWPIYEAAEAMDLPVALHPFSPGHGVKHPLTGAGHPNNYFEFHSLMGIPFVGQLVSLITEGVFEKFPDLRYVFVEGGFGWVPHMMWRMDKNWRGLRQQSPWIEKPPSEYVREHVRFTSQPIEEPPNPEHLIHMLEMMHAEETLMFASDYPHWDGDSPADGFPRLSEPMASRIFYENAMELYDLPDERDGDVAGDGRGRSPETGAGTDTDDGVN